MEGAPSLHQEPLNPPAPSFVWLSRVLPAQKAPRPSCHFHAAAGKSFSQERLLPTESLVGAGGCCGGCPVPLG